MNNYMKKIETIPWDVEAGFTPKLAPKSLNAFKVEDEVEESPLPHNFDIKNNKVYVLSLPGYCPSIEHSVLLFVKNIGSERIISVNISLSQFIGKRLHRFMVLGDEASLWVLHDENSRDYYLVKCNSSGEVLWNNKISDINICQGDKLGIFEICDGLLVVKYLDNEIIFEEWNAYNGESLKTWQEPKMVEQLYQVQDEKFIGMSFDSAQQTKMLLIYEASSRRTTFCDLNNEYYGWFHNLIGTDRNGILYLIQGKSLAKYSLEECIVQQINVEEESKRHIKGSLPDYTLWKIDHNGDIYFPCVEEAGLSIIKVQL